MLYDEEADEDDSEYSLSFCGDDGFVYAWEPDSAEEAAEVTKVVDGGAGAGGAVGAVGAGGGEDEYEDDDHEACAEDLAFHLLPD